MKKNIKTDFFSNSIKWNRRIPILKKITLKTLKNMSIYFDKPYLFELNLIFSERKKMSNLNKKYRNKNRDTDVLTFVSKISNKELGKILYCDIFFSIDTIENFIKKNNLTLYDHFNHLLVHSLLHVNGYNHKNNFVFNIMKKEEIKILNKLGIKNPYKK